MDDKTEVEEQNQRIEAEGQNQRTEAEEQKLDMYYRIVRMVMFSFLIYFMFSVRSSFFYVEGLSGAFLNSLPIIFISLYCSDIRREKISFEQKFWLILAPFLAEIFAVLCVGHLHMSFL